MLWILSLLWLYVKIAIPTPAQFTAAFNSPNFSRAVAVAASTFSSDVTCEVLQKSYSKNYEQNELLKTSAHLQ